ncbi:MAG: PAS-domain containing protein [Azospirillaceae bacterium]|nr:PAS-domain containing protein [Azospirillaceae bacterium]
MTVVPVANSESNRVEELEREVTRLRATSQVLMDRVEHGMNATDSAFTLVPDVQDAASRDGRIHERTQQLETALAQLERSNGELERAKLQAETAQLRLIEAIDAVNEGFALFDAEDRLLLCNGRYRSFWPAFADKIEPGLTFDALARLAVETRSVVEAASHAEAWLRYRLNVHSNPRGPYVQALCDGRWMQINERRTRDGGIVGVYTDITDVKLSETRRREQELAEKSALLQATLDNLAQGVSVYDRGLKLVAWNDWFVRLLDLPASLARRGATFGDFRRYNASLGEIGLDGRVLDGDGQDFLEAVDIEQRWHNGRILDVKRSPMPGGGFVMTFSDITARKHAERALREGERRIRTITDALPALIAYVDKDQRYRFVNKPYEDWFKQPRADIDGKPMWVALGPTHYAQRRPYVLAALSGQEVTFEIELPSSEGGQRYGLATYLPHFDENRTVLGYFALIQDITERRLVAEALKEAKESLERRVEERTAALMSVNTQLHQEIAERRTVEAALRIATRQAQEANLSKTRFLAAASHDLLQPLNAARLFVSALADLDQTPQNRTLIENTDVALESVEELLATLLDISKLDAGAVSPEITDFPIDSLLSAMTTEFRALTKDRGLDFRIVSSTAVVRSDIRLLRRIIQNFLSNAVRYTRRGGVLLGCRRRGDALRIDVWDTGPGIPEDKQTEIFEEFRRLGNEQSARDRGMGLGLAIVERISRMLGHPINVRSVVGKGSMFSVTVPLGTFRGSQVKQKPPTTGNNRLTGTMVLVIDNEHSIITGMTALLQGWGCVVYGATSGDEAIGLLATIGRPPDFVIADYHLDHGCIGINEISRLEAHLGAPVHGIVITANRRPEVNDEVEARGYHLLNKPIKPAQLRALMTALRS